MTAPFNPADILGGTAPGSGTGGAAGAMGAGGWLTPTLGILLKALGMFGGKKTQSVLAGHNAGLAIGGLVGQMFGSNNPFAQNTEDKDKDKVIGGSNNLASLGIGGPFGAVGDLFT